MTLFEFGKKMIERHPKLIKVSALVHNKIFYGSIKKTGMNNSIKTQNSFLRKCKFHIDGNDNSIKIGEKCVLYNCSFNIRGNENEVVIDNMVCAYNTEFHIEDDNNKISIGKGTLFCGKVHLACIEGTSIFIGNDCLFSSDIVFRTGDSHSILNLSGERINKSKDINISEHVWIGNRVHINKGVEIRKDSIVATGAIVTSPVEEYNVIIGGVPAKIIKRNISWDKNRI